MEALIQAIKDSLNDPEVQRISIDKLDANLLVECWEKANPVVKKTSYSDPLKL